MTAAAIQMNLTKITALADSADVSRSVYTQRSWVSTWTTSISRSRRASRTQSRAAPGSGWTAWWYVACTP